MYRITKEFHFSASHQLFGLREGHPCARLHGHNYVVVVELAAEDLGPTGFELRDDRRVQTNAFRHALTCAFALQEAALHEGVQRHRPACCGITKASTTLVHTC